MARGSDQSGNRLVRKQINQEIMSGTAYQQQVEPLENRGWFGQRKVGRNRSCGRRPGPRWPLLTAGVMESEESL
jgi:hypothetical protein